MYEVIKEFACAVQSSVREELLRMGGSVGISLLCMVAFFCIILGIYIESRCAKLYAVLEKNQKKLLGNLYIREQKGKLFVMVPKKLLEKSESIYYTLGMSDGFAGRHYMEELFLELPSGRKRVAVKKQVSFKCGLA